MNFLPALRNVRKPLPSAREFRCRCAFASRRRSDARPKSTTASFTAAWSHDVDARAAVLQTVERWRRGARHAA